MKRLSPSKTFRAARSAALATLFLSGLFGTPALADDIDDRVDKARTRLLASQVEFKQGVDGWFQKQEEAAERRGDRSAIKELGETRAAYFASGAAPEGAPRRLDRDRLKARERFKSDIADLISDLTRRGEHTRAGKLEAERDDLLKNATPVEIPRKLWLHRNGLFEQLENGEWEEFSPNGNFYRFREVTRTPQHVELEATTGNIGTRVRLFANRADFAHAPSTDFKKQFEGWWHTLDGTTNNGATGEIALQPGARFVGEKTWTKVGAAFRRGTKQRWELQITKVDGPRFEAVQRAQWTHDWKPMKGLTGAGQIEWSPTAGKGEGWQGVLADGEIHAIRKNGRLTLRLEKAE